MRDRDPEHPKQPKPVVPRTKPQHTQEGAELPWHHLRKDADRDRHRHV